MQGYKFVLMNQHGSSNFLTFNWIWGLLIQSPDETDFRLDSMSVKFHFSQFCHGALFVRLVACSAERVECLGPSIPIFLIYLIPRRKKRKISDKQSLHAIIWATSFLIFLWLKNEELLNVSYTLWPIEFSLMFELDI